MEIGEKLKKRLFNIKNACYSGYQVIRLSGGGYQVIRIWYQISLHKAGLACPDALMC